MKKEIEEGKKFITHYYRQKGSRKKYTNDNPSFWAITHHPEPHAFMKKNEKEYEEFKVRLRSFESNPMKKKFFDHWKHLLINSPSKRNTSGRIGFHELVRLKSSVLIAVEKFKRFLSTESIQMRLFSIFPHPNNITFGLKSLMEKMGIIEKDNKSMQKAASNWTLIIERMLPLDIARSKINSIEEVFSLEENSFKAFNAFRLLQELPEVVGRREEFIEAVKVAMETEGETFKVENKMSRVFLTDAQIIMFQKHSIQILERILPLRATELKKALVDLFDTKCPRFCKMAAVNHILERYMNYGFTSMKALTCLLDDENLINSYEPVLTMEEKLFLMSPTVAFELRYDTKDKLIEKDIRTSLKSVINLMQTDENTIIWLNNEYQRKEHTYQWDALSSLITKEDMDSIKFSVEKVWFGSEFHEKVLVDFNFAKYEDIKRLNYLKNFIHLALESAPQMMPTDSVFVWKKTAWELNEKTENTRTFVYTVKDFVRGLQENRNEREEVALMFKDLGNKGVPYNDQMKILKLLQSDEDVDNITIRVQEPTTDNNGNVSVIDSGPIFIHPEKRQRLNELPEQLTNDIHDLMVKQFSRIHIKKLNNIYDLLLN